MLCYIGKGHKGGVVFYNHHGLFVLVGDIRKFMRVVHFCQEIHSVSVEGHYYDRSCSQLRLHRQITVLVLATSVSLIALSRSDAPVRKAGQYRRAWALAVASRVGLGVAPEGSAGSSLRFFFSSCDCPPACTQGI